jgi:hypothetical protein
MSSRKSTQSVFLSNPFWGDALACLGVLFFFFLCMLLPLVGPAGSRTVHYWPQNFLTFLGVLLLAIASSALGTWSKLRRREREAGAYPWWSAGLTVFYVLWLLVFLLGGLKI